MTKITNQEVCRLIEEAFQDLVADPPRPELSLVVEPDEVETNTWVVKIYDHRRKTYQSKRFNLEPYVLNDPIGLAGVIRFKVKDVLKRLDAFEHGLTWDEFKQAGKAG